MNDPQLKNDGTNRRTFLSQTAGIAAMVAATGMTPAIAQAQAGKTHENPAGSIFLPA